MSGKQGKTSKNKNIAETALSRLQKRQKKATNAA
jgi:hypothetical protein